eukprot:3075114-Karenia_brevis.AAC.1
MSPARPCMAVARSSTQKSKVACGCLAMTWSATGSIWTLTRLRAKMHPAGIPTDANVEVVTRPAKVKCLSPLGLPASKLCQRSYALDPWQSIVAGCLLPTAARIPDELDSTACIGWGKVQEDAYLLSFSLQRNRRCASVAWVRLPPAPPQLAEWTAHTNLRPLGAHIASGASHQRWKPWPA